MKRKLLIIMLIGGIIGFTSCMKDNDEKEKEILNYVQNITSPTTLTADKRWYVEGYVNVNSDLIIEPGTVIKFKENASLHIGNGSYGSLQALGSDDKPILFTSAAILPSPGDWDGIFFYDKNSASATNMTYCIFEYGGNSCSDYDYAAMIEVFSTDIKMTNCTVQKAACKGIYLDEYSEFVVFNNNTIKECETHLMELSATAAGTIGVNNTFTTDRPFGIMISSSTVSTSVIWKKQSTPYYTKGWIMIYGNNAFLTIQPGITIKILSDGVFDIGYEGGKLVASGTATEPITFTSASNSPSKGDWNYINFGENTTGGTILNNCIIEYGAGYSSDDEDPVIDIYSSNVTITNCTIRYNEGYGISIWYFVSPVIRNNTYTDNNNSDVRDYNLE
ncbi:MAG: right-handed parallel beta-helix repeat-containing protein [Salinivirgaceae bacterium]|nr:right-handed parallel beta-helix repeat-containing protein [Salinivirgaceae bacterium]